MPVPLHADLIDDARVLLEAGEACEALDLLGRAAEDGFEDDELSARARRECQQQREHEATETPEAVEDTVQEVDAIEEAADVTPPIEVGAPAAVINLTCDQNAQSLLGDPGDSFHAICPPGCTQSTIWGTDVYTDDSAICTAAIHSGVLDTGGGQVIVTIERGHNAYPSLWRNNIQSQNWRIWHRSFFVHPAF